LELLRVFSENLLPVFLAAGLGYLLAARGGIDPRPLSRIGFDVFTPCLIIHLILENQISVASLLHMALLAVLTLGTLATLAWFLARRLGFTRSVAAAVALVVLVPNTGNYGLSATFLAFGAAGLAQATLFFVISSVISYTAGVFIASAGRADAGTALRGLLRVPAIWAVLAAFVLVATGTRLPHPVAHTVQLLGDATVPVFLLILGIQLHGAERHGGGRALALATSLRLLGGMALSLLLCRLLNVTGDARRAGSFEAAMPSAVICTILATEYGLEPAFVTRVVFATTLLSPITLTPLLAYLKR